MTSEQKRLVVANAERVALRIRSDVARLRAQGFDELAIAAELSLTPSTVRAVLTTPAPIRKCQP